MTEKISSLTRAISLTDEILVLLDQEDFEAIGELDAKRRPLIEEAFSGSLDEVDQAKALHLKELNDLAVSKLIELKASVIGSQKKIRHASKATKAYINNQY